MTRAAWTGIATAIGIAGVVAVAIVVSGPLEETSIRTGAVAVAGLALLVGFAAWLATPVLDRALRTSVK
jgi:hypothetical protein